MGKVRLVRKQIRSTAANANEVIVAKNSNEIDPCKNKAGAVAAPRQTLKIPPKRRCIKPQFKEAEAEYIKLDPELSTTSRGKKFFDSIFNEILEENDDFKTVQFSGAAMDALREAAASYEFFKFD